MKKQNVNYYDFAAVVTRNNIYSFNHGIIYRGFNTVFIKEKKTRKPN